MWKLRRGLRWVHPDSVLHVGLRHLDDILIPHLRAIFDLNYAQSMLVQFIFFPAYFIMAQPSAKVISWLGYQKSIVAGLLVMCVGAVMFIPAAGVHPYAGAVFRMPSRVAVSFATSLSLAA